MLAGVDKEIVYKMIQSMFGRVQRYILVKIQNDIQTH